MIDLSRESAQLRLAAQVILLALLAACDSVSADLPLFTTADEAGAARLHEGLWVTEVKGCVFAESKPLKHWPKCADGWVYERGEMLSYAQNDATRPFIDQPIIAAGGAPRIIQYSPHIGVNGVLASGEIAQGFRFEGFRVTERGADGRVTAFQSWDILCSADGGPVAVDEIQVSGEPHKSAPHRLGVDENCKIQSAADLRKAAAESEALTKSFRASQWVRDHD